MSMEHFVEKLKDIESTFKEVEEKLSDPDVISDQETFKAPGKDSSPVADDCGRFSPVAGGGERN
jgi:protein subunit release factor A